MLRAVTDQGYTEPTPIQAQAIPVVLAGRDLLGAAQTGTGKTAGFTLPMLQRLAAKANDSASPAKHPVRALVLVPTRELAAQVQESVRAYGRHAGFRSTTIFGGVNINPQIAELRRGVDIVVATPGRLLDHIQQKTVDLRHVEILVLDEADRMLDMGFIHDIRKILALLPKERQNLLFSATFSDEIRTLAGGFMKDPASVEVARRNTPAELVGQVVHPVDKDRKRELLAHLVKSGNWQQVLVFCKTKHGANRLAQQLEKEGIQSDAIHGNKNQGARTRALKRFKDNELQVLVATDIAARGLDIEALPHVVNYDLPNVPEDYVHRIGRTGRAGASGEAVSLVAGDERSLLSAIERLMNRKIDMRVIEGFEPPENWSTMAPAPRGNEQQRRGGQQRPQQQRRDNNPRNDGPRQGDPRRRDGAPRRDGDPRGPRPDSAPRREGDTRGPRMDGGQRGPRPDGAQQAPRLDGAQRGPRPAGQRNDRNRNSQPRRDDPNRGPRAPRMDANRVDPNGIDPHNRADPNQANDRPQIIDDNIGNTIAPPRNLNQGRGNPGRNNPNRNNRGGGRSYEADGNRAAPASRSFSLDPELEALRRLEREQFLAAERLRAQEEGESNPGNSAPKQQNDAPAQQRQPRQPRPQQAALLGGFNRKPE